MTARQRYAEYFKNAGVGAELWDETSGRSIQRTDKHRTRRFFAFDENGKFFDALTLKDALAYIGV